MRFFHKEEREREDEGPFFVRLSHLSGFGIPPCSVELSPLSCGAVLLEGVCCWAFVSHVPYASKGLGSKIVCSIDEKA